MTWRRSDYTDIPGVEEYSEPESVEGRTADAIVEVCKRSGRFIGADSNCIQSSMSSGGEDSRYCLPKAFPSPGSGTSAEWREIIHRASPLWVSHILLRELNDRLKNDMSGIRRVSSW